MSLRGFYHFFLIILITKKCLFFCLTLTFKGSYQKKDGLFALVNNLATNFKLLDIICVQEIWLSNYI